MFLRHTVYNTIAGKCGGHYLGGFGQTFSQGKWPVRTPGIYKTDPACCRRTPYLHRSRTVSDRLRIYRFSEYWDHFDNGNIVSKSKCLGTFSVITNAEILRAVIALYYGTQAETVRKRCKNGVLLQQDFSFCATCRVHNLCRRIKTVMW